MNVVKDFEEFKAKLKEKWLDYLESNEDLLTSWDYFTNNYSREFFILGVLSACLDSDIKSQMTQWINFYKSHISSNSKAYESLNFLGLNFDDKKELEQRKKEANNNPLSPLDDIRQLNKTL